jgi:succinoglycan biosynthesis protein ExoM
MAGTISGAGKTSVVVCICTFRRMDGLRRLLASLAELSFETIETPDLSVIVVDNDPPGSARRTVEEIAKDYRWPLLYAVESRAGIPQARNCCLDHVELKTAFVCFVDDDEWVEPAWLEQLLSTQRMCAAHVVAGPVLPIFPSAAQTWVQGRLFVRARHPTGETIAEAATNNVLFKPDLAVRHGIRFNEAMALTGGTDKLFFEELRAKGAKMVWCDEAVVHEVIPSCRLHLAWFIQRGFRIGTTDARIARITKGRWKGIGLSIWRAASRGAWAFLFLPVYLVLGKGAFVHNAIRLAYGVGSLFGSLGISYDEYAAMRRAPATIE